MPCRCFIVSLSCESPSPFLSVLSRRGKLTKCPRRLLFMTYNGPVMIAVAVGAFVGYLAFGEDVSAAKTVACH